MKIYDLLDEDAPCRDCENFNDGYVSEDGEEFHEFSCSGGYCLYCAERSGFSCFEKADDK